MFRAGRGAPGSAPPRPAALPAPGGEGSVQFPHVVVEEHVGGAGGLRPELGADDPVEPDSDEALALIQYIKENNN